MSQVALDAISTLSKTTSMNSPASIKAATDLTAEDATLVQESLITELRKVTDWASKPNGLTGAILLADLQTSAAVPLARFLRGMTRNEPWFKALTKNTEWLKGK